MSLGWPARRSPRLRAHLVRAALDLDAQRLQVGKAALKLGAFAIELGLHPRHDHLAPLALLLGLVGQRLADLADLQPSRPPAPRDDAPVSGNRSVVSHRASQQRAHLRVALGGRGHLELLHHVLRLLHERRRFLHAARQLRPLDKVTLPHHAAHRGVAAAAYCVSCCACVGCAPPGAWSPRPHPLLLLVHLVRARGDGHERSDQQALDVPVCGRRRRCAWRTRHQR